MTPKDPVARPRPWRRRVLLGAWLTAAAIICVRAVQIQVVQSQQWRAVAEAQHRRDEEVVAARGSVLDRDGTPLAVSRERFSVGIAPNELINVEAARSLLSDVLGISSLLVTQLTSPERRWSVVPGRYPPAVRQQLNGVRGIHVTRELQRYHPLGDLSDGVLGLVRDNTGSGGVEQAFQELLSGHPGQVVVARDNVGGEIPGERILVEPPRPGGEVVLTLDMDLQEIALEALKEAIERTEARGGDVLITDPHTGEILAFVSILDGRSASLSAINTPFEPGSTLKPFTVAGLLKHDIIALDDTIDVADGDWAFAGRTITRHHQGRMTVADALRVSSNVGIAQAAQPMTRAQQYENLRDFGFGGLTGIEIPGEVRGTLRRPDLWTGQSPASLAIGYEVSVTSLQMAMAYGALANGGRLMQPRLVREIRNSDGTVLERFEPRVIRQVISPRVASSVSRVLEDVVEDGTGKSARLGSFRVAGKSGTSRLYSADVGYEAGAYFSSFVGYFPAEAPQLVVFVKLDRPQGAYYGGAVAAPVTRATMEAALAARATPLDRAALLNATRVSTTPVARPATLFASVPITAPVSSAKDMAFPVGLPTDESPRLGSVVPIPDVSGLPSRVAVRRLHALGLRVSLARPGEILGTEPAAGTRVLRGDTIRLKVRRRIDD
ncbi:MAG: PASTA domain-containing protein [Gemmatimonadetes bacterium]|jgi:cell division protein FtsI (penicillin-binding protein 3)|nr:PASTA domain-containing protein [Gemmatimonadota bacterium]